MTTRRRGQVGQFDFQARSHDAPDCGTYELLERVGPNRWKVEVIGSCDERRTMTVQFVTRKVYDRYF